MPDFFHKDAIDATLLEARTAAQQVQRAAAAVEELTANVNEIVLMLRQFLNKVADATD